MSTAVKLMPKYVVNVLCKDREATCSRVKKTLMNDYLIKDSNDKDNFDHIGIKDFESFESAFMAAEKLKKDSNGDILDVSISPT